ncbi:serine hydrolase domain-containing protein [Falsiroseomonas oryzae]|uniref:serine hydrolase domain-containing protein n=1 Tax=Falsiroseomonas oryzae TaxID=2766473 RepID=UPI0022EB90A4|nr:serine hydrolase [Roseomonas sp. MO-31]
MQPALARRALVALALPLPALGQAAPALGEAAAMAAELPHLRTLIVARNGTPVLERAFRGAGLDRPANIKSASKTVLATLAGIAVSRGVLDRLDQPIGPILGRAVPPEADPRVGGITIRQLLAMRAGLERTSGQNYGRWVSSRDWLRFALSRPMEDEPGGRMIYSTGTSHILGAVLARASGRSLHRLAQDWLGAPLVIAIPDWPRAPEGVHFGGNEMLMSPRALLAFAECWRNGGVHRGRQVVPEDFVRQAWHPQARSAWSGQLYGLGWWIAEARGQSVFFAWGYGGQMAYVLPGLGLSVVMTSDPAAPRANGQVHELHTLLVEGIMPALGATQSSGAPFVSSVTPGGSG